MRTVAFKTVGCRLNQAESTSMAEALEADGYTVVESPDHADILVIHTCTITANAERTCLKAARAVKRTNPGCRVVMAGCAVEASRARLLESEAVDLVADQEEKRRLPDLLRTAFGEPDTVPGTSGQTRASPATGKTRALVKVQDGCDFRCAYCIVPHTRGAPVSRAGIEIIANIRSLEHRGYREIVLTGANLGLFNADGGDLAELLCRIENATNIERIRLSSIESTTAEKRVIGHMASSPRVCRFLHVPLQSGDAGILESMGRKYSPDAYRRTIEAALAALPDIGLGTDVIVGFPGEDDEAFRNTVALIESLPFSNLHIFPYSARPHTRASALPGRVPDRVKKKRGRILAALAAEKRRQFARSFIGKPVTVLIERIDPDGMATGWTGEYIEARLPAGEHAINDIVTVAPTACDEATLLA